ncbi:MAG: diguanylate cyclase [Ketobacteraceae bacterium]|nr:diguanylate cyclase [Ketobacteraceae bacterium]
MNNLRWRQYTAPAFRYIGSLLCWLALAAPASGEPLPAVEVSPQLKSVALGPHFEYLVDPERNLTLSDVKERTAQFKKNDERVLNPGYTSAGYWVRFRLQNNTSETVPLYLNFQSLFVDHLHLYIPSGDGSYRRIESGRFVKHHERPYESRHYVFPLEIPPNSDSVYYLYCDSADTLTIPLYLFDEESLHAERLWTHSWLTFYQGVIVAVAAFSIFLMLTVRDRVYVYYIFAIIIHHGFFFTLFDGLGHRYFGFESTWWHREALSVFVCFSMAAILQFSRVLLNTEINQPQMDKVVRVLIYFAMIIGFISIFIDYFISIRITNPIASMTAVIACIIGWNSYLQGNSAARYFMLAWISIIIGGLAYSLKSWGLVPSNFFTEYGWQMGSAIEALLLSMAIAERINIEVRNREKAQQQVQQAQRHALDVQRQANETLEQRVQERTEALERANQALQEISETDQLTGVKNRRYMDNFVEREFSRANRMQQPIAVILLDVDHFKSINDNHGHLVGDDCLKKIAELASRQPSRPSDLLARYGGEEFCFVLPDTDAQGAYIVAERVRKALAAEPITTRIGPLPVSASFGIHAGIPDRDDAISRFFSQADEALYQSKQDGRNRATIADSAL